MIKSVKFTEDNNLHCLAQIKAAFSDIGLEVWWFYRPDSSSHELLRAETIGMNDINFRNLAR